MTLLSTKVGGFSFLRGLRFVSKRLRSSPRAFKESVCPAASTSEIDFSEAGECLVFAPAFRSLVGKSFSREPTSLNRQDSAVKGRCVASGHASIIVARSFAGRRFILSAEAGGFLAARFVRGLQKSSFVQYRHPRRRPLEAPSSSLPEQPQEAPAP